MLVPAIVYREELLNKFAKEIYSDRYFYYMGYGHGHDLPDIRSNNMDDIYQWAVVDNSKKKEEVIGWFAYRIYTSTKSAENFGLYSFQDDKHSVLRNALILGRDIYEAMHRLISTYHKVCWRVISGNPVMKSYDRLCAKFNRKPGFISNSVRLHDCTTDAKGQYHDEIIYEIINLSK